jgi:hypothetical protein
MLKMTRSELHALVWSKPMTEIAREHGVRDQHIAQACDIHDIGSPVSNIRPVYCRVGDRRPANLHLLRVGVNW